MRKGKMIFLIVISLLIIASASPVWADQPKGKGKTKWDLNVEAMHPQAVFFGYDIYGDEMWGVAFMLTITTPNPNALNGFTLDAVDVYKDGVLHHEITPLQQSDPQKYTIVIQEVGCPADTSISYTIVTRRGKPMSEDVTISYLCQP